MEISEGLEPLSNIVNWVEIESDDYFSWAVEVTGVCCYGGDIIYVDGLDDPNAEDVGTGLSWDDAYGRLDKALERAAKGCGNQIWVAKGLYNPPPGKSFELVEGVGVYGGFAGNETSVEDRKYVQNKTYLSADGGDYAVSASGVDDTAVLDGFIITGAAVAGIFCNNADPNIINCAIGNNQGDGIYCTASDAKINNCLIAYNEASGIFAKAQSAPIVSGCFIHNNDDHGFYCKDTASIVIKNNFIHHNGADGSGDGIFFDSADSSATVRNNTIAHNADAGINKASGVSPTITNCIIWGNDTQLAGLCIATYSCVQGSTGDNNDPNYNIGTDPNFADSDPNTSYNYHLGPLSPCIDTGFGTYTQEKDIDAEDRMNDGNGDQTTTVDRGADEYHNCDAGVYSQVDFNGDGIINLNEYAALAQTWLVEAGSDPNWNPDCDFNNDDIVDLIDLHTFLDDWLWMACWKSLQTWQMTSMGDSIGEDLFTEPMSMTQSFAQQQAAKPLSIEEQIVQLKGNIELLEEIWDEDEETQQAIDEKEWQDFMERLDESLENLVEQM